MNRAGLKTFATAIGIVILGLGTCSVAEELTCGRETSTLDFGEPQNS